VIGLLRRPPNGPLLVIGASGFVGAELVRVVSAGGRPVVGTYNRHPPLDPGSEHIRLDARRRGDVSRLIGRLRPWAVVNLAYAQDGPEAVATTVHAAAVIAREAAVRHARLLFLSTDCVYSGRRGGYGEDDPPDPVSPYGWAKLLAERAVREELPAATVVRTSLVLRGFAPGPPSRHELLVEEVASGRREMAFFSDERRSPIAVADLAVAIDELIRTPRPPRLLHVAGAEDVSRYELALLVASARALPVTTLRAGSARALGRPRPLDCTLDSARARRLLGTRLRAASEFLGPAEAPATSADA
jgi:dTDP-4-dehydrorhamnose reductase